MNEAIATRGSAALAVPDYLKDQIGKMAGLENVDQSDLLIPRLGVAQALSPQLKKSGEDRIQDLKVGDFFNSATSEIYGTNVTIVPLFYFKTFIEFTPIDEGGGIAAVYQAEADVPKGHLDFIGDEKPRVTRFNNWMSLIIREGQAPEPIIVSFKSSGLKESRKWTSEIRRTKMPAYARFYTLNSVTRTKGELEWEGIKVVLPGQFVPEEFFKQAEEAFNQLHAAGVQMDTRGLTDEPQATSEEAVAF